MMHTLTMIDYHEGTEVWKCPTCGREVLVEWYPKFRKTVTVKGDEMVNHSAMKGAEFHGEGTA